MAKEGSPLVMTRWVNGAAHDRKVQGLEDQIRQFREVNERERAAHAATIAREVQLRDQLRAEKAAASAMDSSWVPPQPLPAALERVLRAVISEYWRAKGKHGEMTMDGTMDGDPVSADRLRLAALMEEVGEVAHEMTYDSQPSWVEGGQLGRLQKELIQVANVAATWASYLTPGPAVNAAAEHPAEPMDGVGWRDSGPPPFAGRFVATTTAGRVKAVYEGSTVRVPEGMVALMVPSSKLSVAVEAVLGS